MKLKDLKRQRRDQQQAILATRSPKKLESLSSEQHVVDEAAVRQIVSVRRSLWHARWYLLVLIPSVILTVYVLIVA